MLIDSALLTSLLSVSAADFDAVTVSSSVAETEDGVMPLGVVP